MANDGDALYLAIVMFFGGLFLFVRGFTWRKQLQQVLHTPTSKVRSIAMGAVELFGKARMRRQIMSPLTKTPCAYYHMTIEEYRVEGKSKRWVTVDEDASVERFYLVDETGEVLIDPAEAEIDIPMTTESRSGRGKDPSTTIIAYLKSEKLAYEGVFGMNKDLRFREYLIKEGDPLYILGTAKKNPAVKGAVTNAGSILIAKGEEHFLISAKKEEEVLSALRGKVFGGWVGGGLLAAGGLALFFWFIGIL
jgi:uncharacterized protein YjeT (DUF2065 family)